MLRQSYLRAFTLVELVVVVSIVAILILLAVPSILEAQARAKLSRVLADFSTLRTGVETYAVDHGRYPRMTVDGPPYYDTYSGQGHSNELVGGTLGPWVTTPIAYVHQFDIIDPFMTGRDRPIDQKMYTWNELGTLRLVEFFEPMEFEGTAERFDNRMGAWMLLSLGPDGFTPMGEAGFLTMYDPTNGTFSLGNVIRSQKHSGPDS